MGKRKVFYSFHFDNDVMRTQQVRNIGVIDGNQPVSAQDWEQAKKSQGGVEKWINDNMGDKDCVIVLIGAETSSREWVNYEIRKAWNDRKPLFGIYIHNLKDPTYGKSNQGLNPFDSILFTDGRKLSSVVRCYNPNSYDAYNDIANNLINWIETAIRERLGTRL